MLQRDADYLFGLAYALDSHKRVKTKDGDVVILKHAEVEKMAEGLRELAAKNEAVPELMIAFHQALADGLEPAHALAEAAQQVPDAAGFICLGTR